MAIDREKYRRLFVEEARESLRTFGNDLVALEKMLVDPSVSTSPQTVARAREVMDAAFRTAHSLKGMGAAMGYARFVELAHAMEDLADIARQGQSIGADGFDLLMEGSDTLDAMVARVAEGDSDPDAGDLTPRVVAMVGALKTSGRAAAASAPEGPSAPAAPAAAPESQPRTAASLSGTFAVKVRIAEDASLPQVRAFVVHKALAALPGWRETEPSAEHLRQKELPDRTLVVRFDVGAADPDQVATVARAQQAVAEVVVVREAPPAPEPPAPRAQVQAERSAPEEERTVRVRTVLLDEFIDSVGELLLARSRMRVLAGRVDVPELADLVDEVERLTRDLHDRVVAARMTPLGFITERLPRVVRDHAKNARKPVDFTMQGMEIELDRSILDELQAPILHMLRNAVDHAHEGVEPRRAAGKPPAMQLALRASRERDMVLLELEDDGGGMDPDRLRRRAAERGIITPEAARALTDQQALELVCLPGFSTVDNVSQTSGRGVGMDVVKATLERLGGALRLHSTVGRGSRLVLQLPLTVAIIRVLVVEAGHPGAEAEARDAYAIPIGRVEQAIDVDADQISVAHGRAWIKHGDRLVPLYDLSRELGYATGAAHRGGTVLVLGRAHDVVAMRVDAIAGQEEVVAKPLGRPLSAFNYLSGATLLADGRAAFILEPQRLLGGAGSTPAVAQG